MRTCKTCLQEKPEHCFSGKRWFCKPCECEKQAKRRAANVEHYLEMERRSAAKNRSARVAFTRAWRESNRGNPEYRKRKRAAGKRYWEANKQTLLAKMREVAAHIKLTEPHKLAQRWRKWRKENLPHVREYARRKAHERRARGAIYAEDVRRILELQRGRCVVCRIVLNGKYHIDHITPVARGGDNQKHNLQILCPRCNCSKGAKDPVHYMQSKGYLL